MIRCNADAACPETCDSYGQQQWRFECSKALVAPAESIPVGPAGPCKSRKDEQAEAVREGEAGRGGMRPFQALSAEGGVKGAARGASRTAFFAAFLLASEVDSSPFFFSSVLQLLLGTAGGGERRQGRVASHLRVCPQLLPASSTGEMERATRTLPGTSSRCHTFSLSLIPRARQPLASFLSFNNLFLPSDL